MEAIVFLFFFFRSRLCLRHEKPREGLFFFLPTDSPAVINHARVGEKKEEGYNNINDTNERERERKREITHWEK